MNTVSEKKGRGIGECYNNCLQLDINHSLSPFRRAAHEYPTLTSVEHDDSHNPSCTWKISPALPMPMLNYEQTKEDEISIGTRLLLPGETGLVAPQP